MLEDGENEGDLEDNFPWMHDSIRSHSQQNHRVENQQQNTVKLGEESVEDGIPKETRAEMNWLSSDLRHYRRIEHMGLCRNPQCVVCR